MKRILLLAFLLSTGVWAEPPGKPWTVLPDEGAPPVPATRPFRDRRVQHEQSSASKKLKVSKSEVDDVKLSTLSRSAWTGPRKASYAAVDSYALAAPPSAETSIKSLGAYLAGVGPDPEDRLRAIFRWEADRIEYDKVVRGGGEISTSQDPHEVLRNRVAVCDGYARLYSALAQTMGLEVEHVLGYSKGSTVFLTEKSRRHRWIRARLPGGWGLIDPTWSRGLDKNSFQDQFFLMPPKQFVEMHYPHDTRWQFLTPPLSRRGFGLRPASTVRSKKT